MGEVFEEEKLVYKKLKIRIASVSNRIRELQTQIGHLHQSSEPVLKSDKNQLALPASEPVLPTVVENAPPAAAPSKENDATEASESSEESEESESSSSTESSSSSVLLSEDDEEEEEEVVQEVQEVAEEEEEEAREEQEVQEVQEIVEEEEEVAQEVQEMGEEEEEDTEASSTDLSKPVEEAVEPQIDMAHEVALPTQDESSSSMEDETTPVVAQSVEEPVEQVQELMAVVVEEPEETPIVTLEDPTPDREDKSQYTAAVGTLKEPEDDRPDDIPSFLEEQANSPISERVSSEFSEVLGGPVSDVSSDPHVNEQAPSVNVPVPLTWQEACTRGTLDEVQRMVNEGADVNQQDAQGHTGLHLAMQNNRVEVVLYLLQQKATVGILDHEKHLPHTQPGCSTNMRRVLISNLTEEPAWVPDETSPTCLICNSQFTFFFRRHHCRCCGVLACGNCTRFRASAPKIYKNTTAQRVCSYCHPVLTASTR